jgi:hypothetical protein
MENAYHVKSDYFFFSPITLQLFRLGPHELTKCVRCNAFCDIRCRNRKKPIARHGRTRMLGSIGFYFYNGCQKCVTRDAFCALVWPQPSGVYRHYYRPITFLIRIPTLNNGTSRLSHFHHILMKAAISQTYTVSQVFISRETAIKELPGPSNWWSL